MAERDILTDKAAALQATYPFSASVSECEADPIAGTIRIRGWFSHPALASVAAFLDPEGREFGRTTVREPRRDVVAANPALETINVGFSWSGPPAMKAGRKITVVFLDDQGGLVHSIRAEVSTRSVLNVDYVKYDTESRQARLAGYFFTRTQWRELYIETAAGQRYELNKTFIERADADARFPEFGNRFAGFTARLDYIGMGDLKAAQFKALLVDGTAREIPLALTNLEYDPPLGEIGDIHVDLLLDTIEIDGWFRTKDTVTRIDLWLGETRLHGFLTLTPGDDINAAELFRGHSAVKFKLKSSLTDALQSREQLIQREQVLRADIFAKETMLLSLSSTIPPQNVRNVTADWLIFDRRTSMVMMTGRYFAKSPAAAVDLKRGSKVFVENAPTSTLNSVFGALATNRWSSMFEINGVIGAADRLDFELVINNRNRLHKRRIDARQIAIVESSSVTTTDRVDFTRSLFSYASATFSDTRPLVTIIYPGSFMMDHGGGATRVRQIAKFLGQCGFRIMVIDRSEPHTFLENHATFALNQSLADDFLFVPKAGKAEMLKLAIADMEAIKNPTSHQTKILNHLRDALKTGRLGKGESTAVFQRMDSQFNGIAAYLIDRHRPQLVVVEFVWSTEVLKMLPPATKSMVDTHDVQSHRYEEMVEAVKLYGEAACADPKRFYAERDEEAAMLAPADYIVAISGSDQSRLSEMVGAHKVVRAGLTWSGSPLESTPDVSHDVLFVGNAYEPNSFSIKRFIREQWPAVRARVPDAILHVAGSVCESLQNEKKDGLVLHGRVSNLEPLYRQCAVVLNPVLFGSGMSVKTIEGVGMGKCLVCSDVTAAHFPDILEADAMVSSPFEGLGEAVAGLLEDPETRRGLERRASAFAQVHLSQEYVFADLMNAIETAIFY